jgi:hypothetical protein
VQNDRTFELVAFQSAEEIMGSQSPSPKGLIASLQSSLLSRG